MKPIRFAETEKFHTEAAQMTTSNRYDPELKLNDNLMRAIGIPLFGVATPNLTGLFERKSFKLFLINAGYSIVALTVMGVIIAAWK